MKIVLLVEGDTETFLPPFVRRWLDPKLSTSVGIKTDKFKGVGDYRHRFGRSARLYLANPEFRGVIGLIDYHNWGLNSPAGTVAEKCRWAKKHFEAQVGDPRFRQHFAVHETEAWLLAQPEILPKEVQTSFRNVREPEAVNTTHSPSERLRRAYHQHLAQKYSKPLAGGTLFAKLDPVVAHDKCPHLRLLLDDLLALSR